MTTKQPPANFITIPDELNIILNTSVPGFQKIHYKPYMTIPNISRGDRSIKFNPLIMLNQEVINKVPENMRKREFFNDNLFKSLINFNDTTPVKNLKEATLKGIVDNNIKIILDTLFTEESVIYINKKPYVITDVLWTKGDWKVDSKKTIEDFRGAQSYYYSTIKKEIAEGKEQLNKIPYDLRYGPNYSGKKSSPSVKPTPISIPKAEPIPNPSSIPKNPNPAPNMQQNSAPNMQQKTVPNMQQTPAPNVQPSAPPQSNQGPENCRSYNLEPHDCVDKTDYKKQALLFHPDKNTGCQTEANINFQKLNNLEHCLPFSNQGYTDNIQQENALIGGYPNYNRYNQRNYNPYYNPRNYNRPYYTPNTNIKKYTNQLAYYIVIDIDLHPGTTITPELKKELKCKNKWNAVRKAYSEFTGSPFSIKPSYNETNKTNKNKNIKPNINQTKKKYYNRNNYYRGNNYRGNNYYPRNKYTRKNYRNY